MVGPLAKGNLTSLLAVLRCQNLEIAHQLEPHFKHIDVIVVVFDVKNFDHDVDSILFCT